MFGRRVLVAAGGVAVGLGLGASTGSAAVTSVWTTYHADAARSGVAAPEPKLTPLAPAWTAALDGAAEYGQPVVADGRIFVGTEDDDVYALDGHDGHVLWHANIGKPLVNVSRWTGCGDIDPLGITSTPVVDTASSTVFVVGEVSTGGALPVHHELVGFNLMTGAVTVSLRADPKLPAGEDPRQLQQRAALALGSGRVYVAYGGLAGDCGAYHGWIVGLDETGSRPAVQFDATPGGQGGAIWAGGGGPSIDSTGHVYATTGNPNGTSSVTPYADDVIKLGASLDRSSLVTFHDSHASPNSDADLGTGDATLVPAGTGHSAAGVFAVGKSDYGYLLRQRDLGVMETIPGVCGSDPDGGEAWDAATNSIYVPCRGGGIQQVRLGSHSLGWHAGGANGAPILVNGKLWALAYGAGTLEQLAPRTGAVLQTITSGAGVPNFASPSCALGLILVGTDAGVEAFAGPGGPPPAGS